MASNSFWKQQAQKLVGNNQKPGTDPNLSHQDRNKRDAAYQQQQNQKNK